MHASNARNSSAGTTSTATGSSNMVSHQPQQLKRKLPPTGGKLMRLRCRFRTLHESYLTNGTINENDADVAFITMDGQKILAHKIILCSASTLFSSIFADQHCGEMTSVMVPDVRGDTMRLILQLAYTESVTLTMKQIKEVGNFISLFGMEWKQFNFDGFDDMVVHGNTMSAVVKSEINSKEPVSNSQMARHHKQQPAKADFVNSKQHYLNNQTYLNISANPPTSDVQNDSGDSQDSDDFTFKLQGYEEVGSVNQKDNNSSRLKQQLTAPISKPTLTYGRSPSGNLQLVRQMPVLHSSRSQNANYTPRIEAGSNGNNDTDFGGINSCNEDSQKLIKEWIAKVGKEEDNIPAKRIRHAMSAAKKMKLSAPIRQPTPPLAANQPLNTCTVCNITFADRSIWKWHEQRHIGMGIFKCCHCPLLFGTCKKLVYHEETQHGFQVPPQIAEAAIVEDNEYESTDAGHSRKVKLIPRNELPETSPAKPAIPPLTLIKSGGKDGNVTQYKRVASAIKVTFNAKKAKGAAAPKSGPSEISIGISPGTEHMDVNKLKQLHWLYTCMKCDNCADKTSKAMEHYRQCYPDKEVPFEKSIVKYRQGFYGKYRCPLCPRRYTSITGFIIHCGHMHSNYRKVFTQTQGGDLKCMDCKVEYSLPAAFHDHLTDGKCPNSTADAPSTEQPAISKESHNKKKPKQSSNIPKKEYENPYDDMSAKRRSQTYIGRSPRSARLANRIINETLAKNPDNVDETSFPNIDCPICGTDNITNINLHLTTDHSELGIEVQRVSDDLLRCRKCNLTFAICDLFSHSNSCTGSKEFEFVSHRRAIAAKNKSLQTTSPTKVVESKIFTIPEGLGQSPIDKMDIEDLNTVATLTAAMKCNVCGKVGRKLSIISDCLRHHGIHRCAVCFNTYANKLDYSVHLKQFHGKGNPAGKLTCPICLKLFVNAGQVVGHMFKIHWIALMREEKISHGTNNQASKPQLPIPLDKPNIISKPSDEVNTSSVEVLGTEQVNTIVPENEITKITDVVVADEAINKEKEEVQTKNVSEISAQEEVNQNSVPAEAEGGNNSSTDDTKKDLAKVDNNVTVNDNKAEMDTSETEKDTKEAETKTEGSAK